MQYVHVRHILYHTHYVYLNPQCSFHLRPGGTRYCNYTHLSCLIWYTYVRSELINTKTKYYVH